MVKTLERHRYALCEKHVIVPFCCSYQVYRYLAGCFGLISCRHYLNIQESITEKSITDISNIHQSIYPASGGTPDGNAEMDRDRIDRIDTYREIIKENIEFEALVQRYGYERVDELVELMLQTVLSQRPYIRIAGDDYPREVVKSRFLKVNFSHVEYVFDCLDSNTTKVRNIKSYLLAALYNAPTTMDSYYRAEVNHDLYG